MPGIAGGPLGMRAGASPRPAPEELLSIGKEATEMRTPRRGHVAADHLARAAACAAIALALASGLAPEGALAEEGRGGY